MSSVRVMISGKVQGVGYRAWTISKASSLGLKGWVRNRKDGNVEAVFIGDEAIIHQMIEACKEGPMLARVNGITSYQYTQEDGIVGFTSKPTF